jgi:hypothetical protein
LERNAEYRLFLSFTKRQNSNSKISSESFLYAKVERLDLKQALHSRETRLVIVLWILYVTFSFAYSFIGFIHYQPGSHYHEYSPAKLAVEVGGHLIFGFVASIPFLNLRISMLTTAFAILIDVDHILSAIGFDVSGRPDHSILFAALSSVFIVYLAVKMNVSKESTIKLAFVGAVTVLAHLSYDVFASNGSSFQLFIPFSFVTINFSDNTWIILEVAAIVLAIVATLTSKLSSKSQRDWIASRERLKL